MRNSNYKNYKRIAMTWVLCLAFQVFFPISSWALTSGPSKPEVQSFEPVATTNMVDMFSGDFNYNIPLFDIGGYPINLAYHAGAGMEDEASWVGLGWNINPGAITRNMRGLPDDFNGEEIEKELNIRDNFTASLAFTPRSELVGIEPSTGAKTYKKTSGLLKGTFGVRYNNFKGISVFTQQSFGKDILKMGSYGLNASLGLGSGEGITITPSLSIHHSIKNEVSGTGASMGLNIGAPYNSRVGLNQLNFTLSSNPLKRMKNTSEFVSLGGNSSSGTMISFNVPSYTPSIEYNTTSSSGSLDLAPGFEIPVVNLEGSFNGTISNISVLPYKKLKAYGYYYHQNSDNFNSMLDFNREKDGTYYKTANFLPPTIITNDIYSASAQGFGGPFRLFRSHLSYVHDNFAFNKNTEDGTGYDAGTPASTTTYKGGANKTKMTLIAKSGLWTDQNDVLDVFPKKFKPENVEQAILHEDAYFKMIGEATPDNKKYYRMGMDEPLVINLSKHKLKNEIINRENKIIEVPGYHRKINGQAGIRDIRSTVLNPITISDAEKLGILTESFESGITINNFIEGRGFKATTVLKPVERTEAIGGIKQSQIYMLEGITPNGSKYVYGLPVYNLKQTDVVFNINKDAVKNLDNNTVSYVSKDVTTTAGGGSNSNRAESNENGMDYFVSKERMPAYAYAYLLTSMQSPEYRDLDGNGPSDGDLGNWVKFNYSQTAGVGENIEPYRWRFPYIRTNNKIGQAKTGQANLNLGLKTTSLDDKGNYTYGEKELWNLHSIESRDMVAVFITNKDYPRLDGYGVMDEFGTTDTNGDGVSDVPLQQVRLDRIDIYSKVDFQKLGENAVPIKSIHFEYENILCDNTPNAIIQSTGKLTLRKLYFTYGTSLKGQFSKYEFDYYGSSVMYNRQHIDRWGNYKKPDDGFRNDEFPYAKQNEEMANEEAAVYNLKSIDLPSGGRININYEADDYAFVQDKRASKMAKAIGTAHMKPSDISQVNTQGLLHDANHFYNYIVFDLGKLPSTVSNAKSYFYQKYLKDLEYIYFRSFLSIVKDKYEFVPGYTKFDDYGVFPGPSGSETTLAYIHLKPVGYGDSDIGGLVNPISKAGWQFARLHTPHLVYADKNFEQGNNNVKRIVKSLFGILKTEVPRMIIGFNHHLKQTGYAAKMDLSKSTFRLLDPHYSKNGGGHRVKSISMTDNWTEMTGSTLESDLVTGVQYFYQKVHKDEEGNEFLISSGVASYEPVLGADENTLKTPVTINESFLLAPSNQYYLEEPIGESYFPAANVGYSHVLVANIRNGIEHNKTATGYELFEYYTAKDFPYKVIRNTGKQTPAFKSPLLSFFTKRSFEYQTVSQGYSIILNDMHGKEKARHSFAGGLSKNSGTGELELGISDLNSQSIKSSQLFKYKIGTDGKLSNAVQLAKKFNSEALSIDSIGVESDISFDFRENFSSMRKLDFTVNFDAMFVFAFIPFPSFWVLNNKEENRFRSSVITKVINKHGILDKVQVVENGSVIETKNLVYEENSGRILVTSVNNEFKRSGSDDPEHLLYQLNMPAYWSQRNMGPAYNNLNANFHIKKSTGNKFKIVNESGGALPPISNLLELLNRGDRILIANGPYYVALVYPSTNEFEVFGSMPNTSETLECKLISSKYTNKLTMDMAALNTLNNPSSIFFNNNSVIDIINAEYMLYDSIRPYCNMRNNSGGSSSSICYAQNISTFANQNKVFNIRNKFKNKDIVTPLFNGTNYEFSDVYFSNLRVSKSGSISSNAFNLFWQKPGNEHELWTKKYSDLVVYNYFNEQVFFISPNGETLMERDEYNREFATVYGYNRLVPVIVAQNANYQYIGFDGFEEYKYLENLDYCINTIHFSILSPANYVNISNDAAHTGLYSLRVDGSSFFNSTIFNLSGNEACFGDFSSDIPNEPYIIEAWVKAIENKAYMTLEYLDNNNNVVDGVTHSLSASSKSINGWRRIYYTVAPWINNDVEKIKLSFINQTGENAYFDDIRFYPAKALVKSYVYHPRSLKLMAELDENHHATYYEYDESWNLVRVKKETDRGIVTVNENRASIRLKRNGGI